ncbi:MAG: hypothetical protein ACE5HA_11905, partial [Anaerolineae bacterium]
MVRLLLIPGFVVTLIACVPQAISVPPTPTPVSTKATLPTPAPVSPTSPPPPPVLTATATRPPATPTATAPPATPTTTRAPATATASPPPSATPVVCRVLPEGGFLTIWQGDPDLRSALGCPTSYHPRVIPRAWEVKTAYQPFEHGAMIWSDHIGWYPEAIVLVLYADSTYQRFEDTFDPEVDPARGGETPPDGLVEPMLGFGKVWRAQPAVRER